MSASVAPPAAPSLPHAEAAADVGFPWFVQGDERVVSVSGRVASTRGGELWITDDRGENPRRLTSREPFAIENGDPSEFAVQTGLAAYLTFAPDGSRLYFLTPGWGTSLALLYFDMKTEKVYLFHDAHWYRVIQSCKDTKQIGRVITFEHTYDVNPGGAENYYTLLDSRAPRRRERRTGNGGRIGVIGPEEANLQRFMAKTCGEGDAPPDESPPRVPPELRGSFAKCNGDRFRRIELVFLDGTRLVRFTPDGFQMLTIKTMIEICGIQTAGGSNMKD